LKSKNGFKGAFAGFATIAIPIIFAVGFALYFFVMGNPENFQGNNTNNMPKPGNFLGIIYKGGIIVPILMSVLMMVITFSIERFITLTKAKGKGSISSLVLRVYQKLSQKDIDASIKECDNQKGSVANVIKAGLEKYKEVAVDKNMNKDQKILAIKQEFEEATSLELPILEQNLVILATLAPLSTLIGLLGTVLGMIKAFSALATAGAPDAVALSTGISEALINTAFGIGSSALAIIFYSYFTTKIDKMTYSIDEAGVAIAQNFAAHNS
jgi:biopolymer transport protein ExbB